MFELNLPDVGVGLTEADILVLGLTHTVTSPCEAVPAIPGSTS